MKHFSTVKNKTIMVCIFHVPGGYGKIHICHHVLLGNLSVS